jgi:hypothetical protein
MDAGNSEELCISSTALKPSKATAGYGVQHYNLKDPKMLTFICVMVCIAIPSPPCLR